MRNLVLGVLLVLTGSQATSEPAPSGGWAASTDTYVIVALKQPCPASIAASIHPEIRDQFHLAQGVFPDRSLNGCWAAYKEQAVFLWENGDYGYLSQGKFRILREA